MSEKVVKNWLALAEFETAKAMLKSGRYRYVAFICQQCIEKTLKAIFVQEYREIPPYTHNLIVLAKKLSCANEIMQIHRGFLERLNAFYIESRYAEAIDEISRGLTESACVQLLLQTEEFFGWLKTK